MSGKAKMALSILLQVPCILHFIHILLLLPISCPERVLCVLCDFNSEQTHILRNFLQRPCIQYYYNNIKGLNLKLLAGEVNSADRTARVQHSTGNPPYPGVHLDAD